MIDGLYREIIGWPVPRKAVTDREKVQAVRELLAERRRSREANRMDRAGRAS